jgi:hypothetical protein
VHAQQPSGRGRRERTGRLHRPHRGLQTAAPRAPLSTGTPPGLIGDRPMRESSPGSPAGADGGDESEGRAQPGDVAGRRRRGAHSHVAREAPAGGTTCTRNNRPGGAVANGPGVCTAPTVVSRPPPPRASLSTGTPSGLMQVVVGEEPIATSHTVAPAGGTTCTRNNRPGGAVANGPGVCTAPTVVSRPPSPRASLSTGTPSGLMQVVVGEEPIATSHTVAPATTVRAGPSHHPRVAPDLATTSSSSLIVPTL